MAEYTIYPAVDASYNFPPEVRQALILSTDVQTALDETQTKAVKAGKVSPTFTGTPSAPTPSQNDNSERLATTAYVDGIVGNVRARGDITASTDLNSLTTAGIYLANGIVVPNAASKGVFAVERSGVAVVQRYYEETGAQGQLWRESGNGGTNWNSWSRSLSIIPAAISKTDLNTITTAPYGAIMLCSDKISYRWNGTKWCPWESAWIDFSGNFANVNLGNGGLQLHHYRWESGQVHIQSWANLGSSYSSNGSIILDNLPETVRYYVNSFNNPIIPGSQFTVRDPENSKHFTGHIRVLGENSKQVSLLVEQVTDSFNWGTVFVNGQPIPLTQSEQFWAEFKYESLDYPR